MTLFPVSIAAAFVSLTFTGGTILGQVNNSNGRPETVYYVLNETLSPWADSELEEFLRREFTRSGRVELLNIAAPGVELPDFPRDFTDNMSVFSWGAEVGAKYILIVNVDNRYIETRKTFKLPLIFHRYETFGVIEGELRFIDLQRRRLLVSEKFKVERKSGEAFQTTPDDNRHDPDLHISATAKTQFFRNLDSDAASFVAGKVEKYLRKI